MTTIRAARRTPCLASSRGCSGITAAERCNGERVCHEIYASRCPGGKRGRGADAAAAARARRRAGPSVSSRWRSSGSRRHAEGGSRGADPRAALDPPAVPSADERAFAVIRRFRDGDRAGEEAAARGVQADRRMQFFMLPPRTRHAPSRRCPTCCRGPRHAGAGARHDRAVVEAGRPPAGRGCAAHGRVRSILQRAGAAETGGSPRSAARRTGRGRPHALRRGRPPPRGRALNAAAPGAAGHDGGPFGLGLNADIAAPGDAMGHASGGWMIGGPAAVPPGPRAMACRASGLIGGGGGGPAVAAPAPGSVPGPGSQPVPACPAELAFPGMDIRAKLHVLSLTKARRRLRAPRCGNAGESARAGPGADSPLATAGWTFAVTPYLWLPSIDGEFRYRGSSAAA